MNGILEEEEGSIVVDWLYGFVIFDIKAIFHSGE